MRYPVFRTRHVGSATPGAVVESHQLQFSKNPGPSGPEEIAESHSDFARRKFFAPPRGSPRKWGPGKGDYEHEVPIWSRPRWRFAYFAAMGKVGRRPQAAKSPAYNGRSPNPAPSSVTASPCHLPYPLCRFATSPLDKGSRPPRGRLFWGEPPSSAPFGPPSPRGEGLKKKRTTVK